MLKTATRTKSKTTTLELDPELQTAIQEISEVYPELEGDDSAKIKIAIKYFIEGKKEQPDWSWWDDFEKSTNLKSKKKNSKKQKKQSVLSQDVDDYFESLEPMTREEKEEEQEKWINEIWPEIKKEIRK
jgi:hypothetical protein